MSWRLGLVLSCTGVLAILGANRAAAELKVVVTSKPAHSLVAGVMAGVGTPRLLVEGNTSSHTYALKPSDAKALQSADVVVRVSEGLEPFTAKVFAVLPKTVRTVTLADTPGLNLLTRRTSGTFDSHEHAGKRHTHNHGHGKSGDAAANTDAHIWLDPGNARRMVEHIAGTLAAVAPADAATFKANAASFAARIDALAEELARALEPVGAKPFVVFHDSLQYLEARYGLAAAGAIMVSPEDQPSAKRLADLRQKIRSLGAVCVFSEPQFPSKLVNSVTEGTAAKMAVVDPEGGLLTPGPDLYFELMRKVAASLKGCLAGN